GGGPLAGRGLRAGRAHGRNRKHSKPYDESSERLLDRPVHPGHLRDYQLHGDTTRWVEPANAGHRCRFAARHDYHDYRSQRRESWHGLHVYGRGHQCDRDGCHLGAVGSVTVTGTSYPYAATVLADAPTAYWRFGEASGASATDITNNGVSGAYLGGATLGQTAGLNGDPDKAVLLNGSSGYISVPSTPTLQSNRVSIELWIKK